MRATGVALAVALGATAGAGATQKLLILPSSSSAPPSCASYHSSIASSKLYLVPSDCALSSAVDQSSILEVDEAQGSIYWVQPTALDPSHPGLADLSRAHVDSQHAFSAPEAQPKLLASLANGHEIVQFASDEALSAYTRSSSSAYKELVHLSLYPPPQPVPPESVSRIAHHLKQLKFEPLVSTLLNALPRTQFKTDVMMLSGEDQQGLSEDKGWKSRHSMSEGGHRASDWMHCPPSVSP
jgi:hypothetical protein